jgi:hypothetical protein
MQGALEQHPANATNKRKWIFLMAANVVGKDEG